ncbi:TetR/AcrR family transcriptional regulator [Hylemonella gracilis]|jgi:TetR/AcrR family transcriptional repressor of nem operon|uniref:TetR/AcrR family transcriptional regulator n=1 Tax=Hylemonella gracilis TaxID=80880 RepID=A0A4P6UJ35_9BURK|nr:TetR/AcrR family transcriptional regulator [Hylemonella gracilis]QBK05033.1 TetR/AcrR family transcriptional regulator [Hylemonella gracilis]
MSSELSPKAAEIVAQTRSLLVAGGYNSFSYADLAQRVNISKASIHHHFPSKATLVQTVVRLYRRDAQAGLATLETQFDDPLSELNAYADYWAGCIRGGEHSFCICAMLATEMPTIPPEVATEVQAHFQDLNTWLAGVLQRGAERGQFHLLNSPTVSARAFMAVVHGAMLVARALDDPMSFPTIVQPAILKLTQAA